MNTSAPTLDFIEITDSFMEDLIGRDLEINELGLTYRGPIAEVRRTSSTIVIGIDWRARNSSPIGDTPKWHLLEDSATLGRSYFYNVEIDTLRLRDNGSVSLHEESGWRGTILPSGDKLAKPTR